MEKELNWWGFGRWKPTSTLANYSIFTKVFVLFLGWGIPRVGKWNADGKFALQFPPVSTAGGGEGGGREEFAPPTHGGEESSMHYQHQVWSPFLGRRQHVGMTPSSSPPHRNPLQPTPTASNPCRHSCTIEGKQSAPWCIRYEKMLWMR